MIPLIKEMPRFRSNIRPVNSNKQIVDSVNLAVVGGTTTIVNLATVVSDFTGTVGECPTGATINSIYLFIQSVGADSGVANIDWYLYKRLGMNSAAPITPGTTGGNPIRKMILHEEKGIPGNALDGAYPLTFRGVIKIPKHMRRMGEGDQFKLVHRGVDLNNMCLKAIYKFYT